MSFLRSRKLLIPTAALASTVVADWLLDQSLSRNSRAVYLAVKTTIAYKFCDTSDPKALNDVHRQVAQDLLNICQANAGLYIKLGQGIASMNHVLPEVYTETLTVLQDRAACVPFSDVESIFERDFGRKPDDLFLEFERTPIASASIAQVHRAKLKDGTNVAVKVIKPHVIRQTPWDLFCYKILVFFFEKVFDLPMFWTTDYTTRHLRQELDFVHEAQNAARTANDFSHRADVHVPQIIWPLTRKGVLTTEWIDGVKFTETATIRKMGLDPTAVAKTMIEVFADQIFTTGFVHCDPHPGNLLVRPHPCFAKSQTSPTSSTSSILTSVALAPFRVVNGVFRKVLGLGPLTYQPHQLCVLDHGLYIEEPRFFRQQYAEFWRALFLRDFDTLKLICTEWGVGDVDFFASLQLFRPFNRESTRNATSAVTRAEAARFQTESKEKIKHMLTNTSLIPLELIFIGRSMNLVRFNNKIVGSPVNRLHLFALAASKGTSSRLPAFRQLWFRIQLGLLNASFVVWQWYMDCRAFFLGSKSGPRTVEEALELQEKKTIEQQLGFMFKAHNLG